jgi:hypothetical protein
MTTMPRNMYRHKESMTMVKAVTTFGLQSKSLALLKGDMNMVNCIFTWVYVPCLAQPPTFDGKQMIHSKYKHASFDDKYFVILSVHKCYILRVFSIHEKSSLVHRRKITCHLQNSMAV